MMRVLNLIAFILIVAAGTGLYQLKYNTQRLQQEVAALRQQIQADNEAVKVLRAEWTYLSRPDRMETLGQRYLALKPVAAAQVISSIEEIAFREDPHAVVAQVDDFRTVTPRLVRSPATRPDAPEAKPAPAPRSIPMPVAPAEERAPLLEVRHEINDMGPALTETAELPPQVAAPAAPSDDPLAFIRQLRFVSATEEVHD
ncbi:MAG TPA: hypothetical protein VIK87_11295 [Sphingomonadales bacterium]